MSLERFTGKHAWKLNETKPPRQGRRRLQAEEKACLTPASPFGFAGGNEESLGGNLKEMRPDPETTRIRPHLHPAEREITNDCLDVLQPIRNIDGRTGRSRVSFFLTMSFSAPPSFISGYLQETCKQACPRDSMHRIDGGQCRYSFSLFTVCL